MRAILTIAASLMLLSGCSQSRGEAASPAQGSQAQSLAASARAEAAPDIGQGNISSSVFEDSYDAVNEAGKMVLKLDVANLNEDGFIGDVGKDPLYVIYDPSCEDCVKPQELTQDYDLNVVEVPVAFYSKNGLDTVGAFICQNLGLEDPSDACAAKVRAMVSNTRFVMTEGIVDLPAVMMPTGWVVEAVASADDIGALLKASH